MHKANRAQGAADGHSSDNGNGKNSRDRMQHRLQRIREENQSPIQKLTHKQMMI